MTDTPNMDAHLTDEQRKALRGQVGMALADQSGEGAYGDMGWITAEHVLGSGWVSNPRPDLLVQQGLPYVVETLNVLVAEDPNIRSKTEGLRTVYQYV